MSGGGVYMLKYTIGKRLAYIASRGGTHVSPGVLAGFGSTMASMLA